MLSSFLDTLNKYNMLAYGDRVIAGLSGGADSVLLLTLLTELRKEYALGITAVHVNHGLRGAEADADENFSRIYSENIGVHFIAFHTDAQREADTLGLSLEEAGREIRYKRFADAMNACGANKIAVAHHLDDNAETVFMRICRGTGLPGLCGIPPVRGPIIRPLIETGRSSIESYLLERNIPYRTDSSNLSETFTRNRVRNTLIPEIESRLGVDFREKLSSLSRACTEDEDFIDKAAREAFGVSLISSERLCVSLSVSALCEYHSAVTSRVIRLALSAWGLKDVSAYHIRTARSLIKAQSGKQAVLPGGVTVKRHFDELRFTTAGMESPQAFLYDLKPGETLYVPELSLYFLLSENPAPRNAVCTKAFLYDKIDDIQIRSRRPGDFIRIRRVGRVKLKDYFINNKIPSYRRGGIGLAAQGGDVLWILDGKNICHEEYEALSRESRKIYIQMWE
ncbi:MAG: tRNA lysidine(34) synthetase TilS [Clostridiales bacterium]|jgi:tRNA(Ile)-lysidine synthase|nr:tRNA lysidine(34) synthetase TilS [Clostridiales bacterium]